MEIGGVKKFILNLIVRDCGKNYIKLTLFHLYNPFIIFE